MIKSYFNDIKTSKYNIKNSFKFKNRIKKKIPNNYIMILFDVVSLHTNVTESLVQKAIKNNFQQLKSGFGDNFTFSSKTLYKIVNFIFQNTYFSLNNV